MIAEANTIEVDNEMLNARTERGGIEGGRVREVDSLREIKGTPTGNGETEGIVSR